MKRFTKSIALFVMGAALFTACQQSDSSELSLAENLASSDLSTDELTTVAETMTVQYSVTALDDNGNEIIIESDEDLKECAKNNRKSKIVFPIDITVDGEVITVNSKEELKALVADKRENGRPAPLEFVFPISVTTADGTLEIASKTALKDYHNTLAKGTHPAFVFPISVIVNEETIVVNSKEELKALMPKKGKDRQPAGPEFVFPISVVTADGNVEIADKDAMKTYIKTLEKGTHPTLVYPVSLVVNEETISVASEEELKAALPKPTGGKRPGGKK